MSLRVLVPAASQALVSEAAILDELGLGGPQAERLIKRASAACESYLGRPLGRATYEETFRLAYQVQELTLRRWPIASVENVAENGVSLAADAFELDAEAGVLRRILDGRYRPWPAFNVVCVYIAGYELPAPMQAHGGPSDLPADIQHATVELIRRWAAEGDRDPGIRSADVPGALSASWYGPAKQAIPEDLASLLDRYRATSV